jgi:hypothetical protein
VRHLGVAVRRADLTLLYDTSVPPGEPFQPPRLVARLRAGVIGWQAEPLPGWAREVLAPTPQR